MRQEIDATPTWTSDNLSAEARKWLASSCLDVRPEGITVSIPDRPPASFSQLDAALEHILTEAVR